MLVEEGKRQQDDGSRVLKVKDTTRANFNGALRHWKTLLPPFSHFPSLSSVRYIYYLLLVRTLVERAFSTAFGPIRDQDLSNQVSTLAQHGSSPCFSIYSHTNLIVCYNNFGTTLLLSNQRNFHYLRKKLWEFLHGLDYFNKI